jgi:hypothetical protein
MNGRYQARWISKDRVHSLKRAGQLKNGIVLDSFKGFIVVEPPNARLGDGAVLSHSEADSELTPAWCLDPQTKISRARALLALDRYRPSAKA